MNDQALARQRRELGQQHGGCMLSRLGPGVRDHQEARVATLRVVLEEARTRVLTLQRPRPLA